MDNQNKNMEMTWDMSIEDDSEGYRLLTPGEYNGRIVRFERGRFKGSKKMPPCNKAVITISVDAPGEPLEITTNLLLHASLEWKLSAFFRAIGRKKHGERLVMNWEGLVGLPIRVHIANRKYTKDGEDYICNDIDRFVDYDPANFPSDPAWLQDAMQAEEETFDEVF